MIQIDSSGTLIIPPEVTGCSSANGSPCWLAPTRAHGSSAWTQADVQTLKPQFCAACLSSLATSTDKQASALELAASAAAGQDNALTLTAQAQAARQDATGLGQLAAQAAQAAAAQAAPAQTIAPAPPAAPAQGGTS